MTKPKPKKPRRPGSRKQSQKRVTQFMRTIKAVNLICEGMTYEEVAKECGWKTRQSAWDAVQKHLANVEDMAVDNMRRVHLERLRKMFTIPFLNAQAGDNFAAGTCLAIMQREAKLIGLDAPARVEATGKDGEPLQAGGVLIVPGAITEEEWEKQAITQQEELTKKETKLAGNGG